MPRARLEFTHCRVRGHRDRCASWWRHGQSATDASAADGVTVAKAVVAKYSKGPTSIGNLPPINKPIPKNKYVITMANSTDAAVVH